MIKYHIGIDPDVTNSGVCVWNAETQTIERLCCLPFFGKRHSGEFAARDGLFDCLTYYATTNDPGDVRVVVDAGWLNRSNFHARANENQRVNAQIGERTGANHETGKKIIEMCEYLELPCELHRPTRSKIGAGYFAHITGCKGRTNQEERDAAMLVFGIR